MAGVIPNLWINGGDVADAVDFYCAALDGQITSSAGPMGPDAGQYEGNPMVINFTARGLSFAAIHGGDSHFSPTEALSLALPCETQDEIDRLWAALGEGGEPGPCGWLKDRYGFAWQVYPAELDEMMLSDDTEAVARVTECFMKVDKRAFDIEELRAAYAGS